MIIVISWVATGCDFIKNTFTYTDKTKALVDLILEDKYDSAIQHFALEHEMARDMNVADLKENFALFKDRLIVNYGKRLEYRLMKSEKRWSTDKDDNMPPNSTLALIEFRNNREYGVLKVLFDDTSGKILNINITDIKQPIPNMMNFWLLGLFAISVPAFNGYVIYRIKKSELKRKWLKYLAVIALNAPTLIYTAIGGFSVKYFNLQLLLGFSFSYMGYMNTSWAIGVPLGGLYWFIKLRRNESLNSDRLAAE